MTLKRYLIEFKAYNHIVAQSEKEAKKLAIEEAKQCLPNSFDWGATTVIRQSVEDADELDIQSYLGEKNDITKTKP